MLLLQHDDSFTKGIILNRPSAMELDGWRVWCGHGQVADGGMFVGADNAKGALEINALHSLEGFLADQLSTRVIKGVSYTSLEGAKALVAAGAAQQSDFWLCVGYSGWAPGQLQMEVEQRDSWYLASADSGTLLKELLREAQELPPPGDGAITTNLGIDTWSSLMCGIGREDDVRQSEGSLADRMLREWARAHLVPRPDPPTPSTPPAAVQTGMVLCSTVSPATGRPADRFLLRDQPAHKAIFLVLTSDDVVSACILNRPTANAVKFKVAGSPRRRVNYCGDRQMSSQLWLHHRPELGGVPVGDSGLHLLPTEQVVEKMQAGELVAADLLLASSVVQFSAGELAGMLAAGEMRVVPASAPLSELWPRVWALSEDDGGDVPQF